VAAFIRHLLRKLFVWEVPDGVWGLAVEWFLFNDLLKTFWLQRGVLA
jgi:hypothetical protein